MRRRAAAGGEALTSPIHPPRDPAGHGSQPIPIDPAAAPPRRLLRGSEQLTVLVGARLLVGISYLDPDGVMIATEQFCGRVLDAADGVVIVERPGSDEPAVLPADAGAFRPAPPGTYRLASSDEAVVDPDFITTWSLRSTT